MAGGRLSPGRDDGGISRRQTQDLSSLDAATPARITTPISSVVRQALGTMELNFYKQTGRDAMGPIVEDLTPPVDLDRDHWRGGERAAVTLVEYGDYECPYSRMAFRTIQRLEQQLAGQLRFVFRQLPLTGIHPHALAAAHFAEAAALQGRFWPMHELLFHRQHALEDSDLQGYADQLGLDRHQLLADLDGQTVRQRVQADADSALASGARGTPTLFINGRLHVAGYDEATLGADLAAAIKEA